MAALFVVAAIGATATAAKPADVISWSNGFPSGEHYNLNVHGKKSGFMCDGSAGGASIFVPEYGDAEIQLVQNKRSSIENLIVRDACGTFDGDPAVVQLPAGEYQVYARILAKPAKEGEARDVVFYPKLVQACNDSGTENFTDAIDCDESFLLGTGVITKDGAFDLTEQGLERIAPTGKGKNLATDVSSMFAWTGWACDQTFDTDGDGEITVADLGDADLNGDGVVDDADLALYLEANCAYLESEWVFNIADLVVYGWDWQNHGSKLVQVRFYPMSSTTFG
ncbi:MAG TPA: hypothetical protein VGB18_04185 [Candidatus Thermoplasmatota archaeon]